MNPILEKLNQLDSIEPKKLAFLQEAIIASREMKEKEKMMPFLLQLSKKARDNQIQFNENELSLIISLLKQNATQEELAAMDKVLAYKQNMEKK